MNTTTLRGIFPEPKPVYRRNFMRENIRNLKEMQGFIQESKTQSRTQLTSKTPTKYRNVAPRVYSNITNCKKVSKSDVRRPNSQPSPGEAAPTAAPSTRTPHRYAFLKSRSSFLQHTSRSVQTERPEDIPKLYETGMVKYPSNITHMAIKRDIQQVTNRPRDKGDTANLLEKIGPKSITKKMQNLEIQEKPDYVQQNIKNAAAKNKLRKEEIVDPLQPPPTYQKGVVPKYLKEQKPQEFKDASPETPTTANDNLEMENVNGLVLLPDEERKEYLKVARENYADLIKELNSMPVSNDTLKKRKRKMEIEDELKRLDEVIKIFQKPKVFVKADA